jgi:hypothetical protein
MRFIKGIFKWTFISLGGLVLLAMFVESRDSSKTSVSSSNTQSALVSAASQPKVANPLRLSLSAIEDAAEENEINLQNRIKAAGGVLVSARVKSVESVWGKPVIHFRGKNDFLDVSAFLSSTDKDRAASLKKGDTVSIVCQTAKKIMGAALYDCSFN